MPCWLYKWDRDTDVVDSRRWKQVEMQKLFASLVLFNLALALVQAAPIFNDLNNINFGFPSSSSLNLDTLINNFNTIFTNFLNVPANFFRLFTTGSASGWLWFNKLKIGFTCCTCVCRLSLTHWQGLRD